MKLVADTNILFSFFWQDSFTKSLILSPNLKIIAPEKSLQEITKYKEQIKKRVNITDQEFSYLFSELQTFVKIFKKSYYIEFLIEAEKISPDIADSEFLALCLKEKLNFWSQDFKLKSQNKVEVISTEELVNLLF